MRLLTLHRRLRARLARRLRHLVVQDGVDAAAAAGPQQQLPPIKQEEATPRYKAELRTELAAGYFERGQYDVALEELGEALKFDPTYPKLYSVYGLVYTELGDEPKAEANFKRGLDLAPVDSEIRHNWGWYLCTHGKPRESISEFEAALRNPLYRSPEIALINAGKCSAQAGDVRRRRPVPAPRAGAEAGQPGRRVQPRAPVVQDGRLDESRALMRFVMAQNPPAAEALYLGMCVERKLDDQQSEQSYVMQLQQPLSEQRRGARDRWREPANDASAGPSPLELQRQPARRAGGRRGAGRDRRHDPRAGARVVGTDRSTTSRCSSSSRRARSWRSSATTSRTCRAARSSAASCATTRGCSSSTSTRSSPRCPATARCPSPERPLLATRRRASSARCRASRASTPDIARWAIPLVLVAIVAVAAFYEFARPPASPHGAAARRRSRRRVDARPELGAARHPVPAGPSAATIAAGRTRRRVPAAETGARRRRTAPAAATSAAGASPSTTELPNPLGGPATHGGRRARRRRRRARRRRAQPARDALPRHVVDRGTRPIGQRRALDDRQRRRDARHRGRHARRGDRRQRGRGRRRVARAAARRLGQAKQNVARIKLD